MRYLVSAVLALTLLPRVLAQDNEAQKLFRAMEKKITQAKAFRFAINIEAGHDTLKPGSYRGSLLLTKDNKVRFKLSGVASGEAFNWEMVSNGKRVRLRPYAIGVSEVAKEEETFRTPKKLHDHIVRMVSRLGVLPNVWRMPVSFVMAAEGTKDQLDMRGWQLRATEKIGAREAKVVRYKTDDDSTFTVWIDAKTLLPLKRVSVFSPGSGGFTATEIYTPFTVDPRIDAGAFDLVWHVSAAEKLFRATEKKIKAANAVQATFGIEMRGPNKEAKGKVSSVLSRGKGSLLFTSENKARLKITVDEMGKKVTAEAISDGKQTKYARSPEVIAKAQADPSPLHLRELISTMVSGPGLWLLFEGEYLNGAAAGFFKRSVESIGLVAFETGAPEKVGGRDAKVVRYMVAGLPGFTDYHITLWIDVHTLLPLKRVLVPVGRESFSLTETCEFALNPKVTRGALELPK
jgi:outer membrane lipoprotein-sorting protein